MYRIGVLVVGSLLWPTSNFMPRMVFQLTTVNVICKKTMHKCEVAISIYVHFTVQVLQIYLNVYIYLLTSQIFII